MQEFERHWIGDRQPNMGKDEFEELVESIDGSASCPVVTMFEGKVLDGWHRLQAAQIVGKDVEFVEFTGGDTVAALAWSHQQNIVRRHLGETQRAIVAIQYHKDIAKIKEENGNPMVVVEPSNRELAKSIGTSPKTADRARKIVEAGDGEAVLKGTKGVREAAQETQPSRQEHELTLENNRLAEENQQLKEASERHDLEGTPESVQGAKVAELQATIRRLKAKINELEAERNTEIRRRKLTEARVNRLIRRKNEIVNFAQFEGLEVEAENLKDD